MTDNVIISIKGKQLYAESGPDEMELVTSGTVSYTHLTLPTIGG